jgi:hypothetical protein
MDLAVITLSPPATFTGEALNAQTIADILWANATPACRLEYISIHPGPQRNSYTAALFLLPASAVSYADGTVEASPAIAIRLCQQAITTSPALSGWHATPDDAGLQLGA